MQKPTDNDVKVKSEVLPSSVLQLSGAEWMTIAHRQRFRCACGCSAILSPDAIIIRKKRLPESMVDSLDIFEAVETKCMPELKVAAELAQNTDRARLKMAWTQSYKCSGYLVPCSLELVPEVFNVDHSDPTRWGGVNDPTNKQILCPNCHAKKSSHETSLSTAGSLRPPPSFLPVVENSSSEAKDVKTSQEKKETKVCSDCGIEKQITEFVVRPLRSSSGYRSYCKPCLALKNRMMRQNKGTRTIAEILQKRTVLYPDGKKFCTFHQAYHSIIKFGSDRCNPDGLRYSCLRADRTIMRKRRSKIQQSQSQSYPNT